MIEGAAQEVNKLSIRNKSVKGKQTDFQQRPTKLVCYSCGIEGHTKKDPNCPARGIQCRKCKQFTHFQIVCKTKTFKDKKNDRKSYKTRMKIRQIEGESGSENEQENEDYTFVVTNEKECSRSKIVVEIGGVSVKMLIDSGSSCNTVDRETWESLKQEKIKCRSSKNEKKIYAYGSTTPLPVAGTFWTEVKISDKSLENQEFIVIG